MRKRIPTLLVLILLIALIGFGIFIRYFQKKQYDLQKAHLSPQYLVVANLSDSSASIIWQTLTPTQGSIIFDNKTVNDDRDDPQKPSARVTHFVTLTGLSADTEYRYQIKNDSFVTSEDTFSFRTISTGVGEKQVLSAGIAPVRGAVMTDTMEPVDEAIVFLNYKNISPKATFVTTAGNFILPLTKILTADLTEVVQIPERSPATLEIRKGGMVSLIQVMLPLKDQPLPAITLGKNENLIPLLALPPSTPAPLEFAAKEQNFDLNNDGKTNTLDSSLISDFINRRQYNAFSDFNNDKVVDEKDLEIIKDQLE